MSFINTTNINTAQNTPKILILISGGGSNLNAILTHINHYNTSCIHPNTDYHTNIDIVGVVADRPAKGLGYAHDNNIPCYLYDRHIGFGAMQCFYDIDEIAQRLHTDIIVLAGFLGILPRWFVSMWSGKIINIHPSLLPKFGGKGMYGLHVHTAVLEAGERESGCSVHWVIPKVDEGDVIAQAKVEVHADDSPQTLQERVLMQEHILYPKVIVQLAKDIMIQRRKQCDTS